MPSSCRAASAKHPGDLAAALTDYEAVRSVEVLRIQNAARNSTEWFENVKRYVNLPPEQFAYSLLTRSQRISHENLRLRDKDYVETYEDWIAERSGVQRAAGQHPIPPMFTPFTVRGVTLKNRVVVSPMAQYSCADGMPGGLPPGAPGCARHGRRRHGGRGDDLRVAGCPHHPRLPGPVERGTARRLEAHRRLRPRQQQREDRDPAGPRRRQGLHPASPGKASTSPCRSTAGCRSGGRAQLAADLRFAAAVPRRHQPVVPRDDAARTWSGCATTSCAAPAGPPRPASTGWSCTARTATCFRASSRR